MFNPAGIEFAKIKSIVHRNENLERLLCDFRISNLNDYLNFEIMNETTNNIPPNMQGALLSNYGMELFWDYANTPLLVWNH